GADAVDDPAGEAQRLFDEILAPDDMAHIARVVNALPLVQLQVIVPYNALVGGFPLCAGCARPTAQAALPPPDGPGQDSAHRGPPEPGADPGSPPPQTGPSPAGSDRRGRGSVAEVLGPHPFFITDGHARELALFPGTTLHRLVV